MFLQVLDGGNVIPHKTANFELFNISDNFIFFGAWKTAEINLKLTIGGSERFKKKRKWEVEELKDV